MIRTQNSETSVSCMLEKWRCRSGNKPSSQNSRDFTRSMSADIPDMMLFESATGARVSGLRRHVKVEVDVLGSPSLRSLYDLGGRKAIPTKKKRKMYDKGLSDRMLA